MNNILDADVMEKNKTVLGDREFKFKLDNFVED